MARFDSRPGEAAPRPRVPSWTSVAPGDDEKSMVGGQRWSAPGTVQEVIMARVDRLPDDTRRLLQTASVIGRSIYHRVLADVIACIC